MKQFYCNGKKGICKNKNCTNCKKFNDTGGNYIEVDENLKQTNFDKITENEWTLAKFIIDTVTHCQFNNCEDCPLYEADGCSRQEKVKEWLQKELEK